MDADIYALVAKYGFKNLHIRLVEIMRDEYTYFQTQFQTNMPDMKSVTVSVESTEQKLEVVKKPRKQRSKAVKVKAEVTESVSDDVVLSLENSDVKDVLVTTTEKMQFRDPKEMKEFQRNSEIAKRKENDEAGINVADILTKDNLKKWIEDEGHTYAWVAREKAGCPDTQVAATAQMMGIRSKISRKRGILMRAK
jgi:regulator of replication initiation timing